MEVLRYEYDPCVMDGTVKSTILWVYYDISTTRKPLCVIIFKPTQINVATQRTSLKVELHGLKMSEFFMELQ